jgi:hypothetical protein
VHHCVNLYPLLLQGIIAAVIGLGTLNRVLYRLALVPLRDYVFFLAQAQNIGYIVIYYFLLWVRYRYALLCCAACHLKHVVLTCCTALAASCSLLTQHSTSLGTDVDGSFLLC